MEPTNLLILALAAAVLAIGFTRRKRAPLAFDDALLTALKRAVEQQGFTIESYEHAGARNQALRTTAFGVRLGDRVVGSLAPAKQGVSASLVVHGMKQPTAALRVGRVGERSARLTRASEVATGDAGFDARFKVNGAPDDAVRALLASGGVRAALEALFATADVVELRLLDLGEQGGAVRVELVLPKTRLDGVRPVADLALALADAVEVHGLTP